MNELIEWANSVTESGVTVTCFISTKYFCSGIFRMINMINDPCHQTIIYSNIIFIVYISFPLPLSWFSLPVSTLAPMSPASRYEKICQWWGNAGPALQTLDQHYSIIESTSRVSWASLVVCKQWICILVYTGASTPEVPMGRRKLKSIDN